MLRAWRVAVSGAALVLGAAVLAGCGGAGGAAAGSDTGPAVISIADATIAEGAVSPATALTMTNATGVNCRVAYSTRDGSAKAPDDYTAASSQIVQISGAANTPFPLSFTDDLVVEADKVFTVVISLAAGSDSRCQINKSVATITIADDDQLSVLSIADATINEASGGQALITMTNPAGRTCNVTVSSTNGTAVAPGDFTALVNAPVTLTNVGSVPLTLATNNDVLVESPETFTLTMALAAGSDPRCQLGDAVATITITSEDQFAVISIADATVTEGTAAQTTISMTNATGVTCNVAVTSANGTAVAPGDYTAINLASFALNGVTNTALNFTVVDDVLVEPVNETFTINIALAAGSDPRCQIGDAQATITIVSNDVFSVIAIGDVTVAEGVIAQLPVTMTNPTGVVCNLTATTANGTAVAPGDFTALTAQPFAINGVASVALPVTTIDDFNVEVSETFTVTLALATGADPRCQIADSSATVTITSADVASVISIGNFTVNEGDVATLPITMTNGTGVTCNLTATTANGTATVGADYTARTAFAFSVTGAGGNVTVTTLQDTLIEPNETFTVTLALATGADPRCQLGAPTATVTIVSDDVAAVISIANATLNEGAASNQTTISMTNSVAGLTCPLIVNTGTGGTATSGVDYTAKVNEAFTLDAASKSLSFAITDDTAVESAETFTVTITLAGGADARCQFAGGATSATATLTIVSNDALAVISIANATVNELGAPDQTTISMTNWVAGLSCPLLVSTTNGTAVAPGDFTAKVNEAFTLDGPSKLLGFTIVDDATVEVAETFTVTITLASGADARCQFAGGATSATATITIVSN